MSGEKHTPGPWFAHKPVNTKRKDFGVTAGKPYDPSRGALRRIAWVGNSSHTNHDLQGEVWANARLIAAAPDMLEALKSCVHQIEALCGELDVPDGAREAIAKAVSP